MDPSPMGFDDIGLDAVSSVFSAIDMDMRFDFREQNARICLFKCGDMIDKLKSSDHPEAVF
jgi:hypothetical protein